MMRNRNWKKSMNQRGCRVDRRYRRRTRTITGPQENFLELRRVVKGRRPRRGLPPVVKEKIVVSLSRTRPEKRILKYLQVRSSSGRCEMNGGGGRVPGRIYESARSVSIMKRKKRIAKRGKGRRQPVCNCVFSRERAVKTSGSNQEKKFAKKMHKRVKRRVCEALKFIPAGGGTEKGFREKKTLEE